MFITEGFVLSFADEAKGPLAEAALYNPYLQIWLYYANAQVNHVTQWQNAPDSERAESMLDAYYARERCIKTFGFGVPSLSALLELSAEPILEVGAGTGYWAWCLRQLGADVLATDVCPAPSGDDSRGHWFKDSVPWTNIEQTDAISAVNEAGNSRSLFMCWPSMTDWPAQALEAYIKVDGQKFFHAGENRGGCTANDDFFDLLDEYFTPKTDIAIPRWDGINDMFSVYHRKGR